MHNLIVTALLALENNFNNTMKHIILPIYFYYNLVFSSIIKIRICRNSLYGEGNVDVLQYADNVKI